MFVAGLWGGAGSECEELSATWSTIELCVQADVIDLPDCVQAFSEDGNANADQSTFVGKKFSREPAFRLPYGESAEKLVDEHLQHAPLSERELVLVPVAVLQSTGLGRLPPRVHAVTRSECKCALARVICVDGSQVTLELLNKDQCPIKGGYTVTGCPAWRWAERDGDVTKRALRVDRLERAQALSWTEGWLNEQVVNGFITDDEKVSVPRDTHVLCKDQKTLRRFCIDRFALAPCSTRHVHQ